MCADRTADGRRGVYAVGDYSAQAVVNTILNRMFPDDPIVGEEDAADLRVEAGFALRDRIVQLANETLTAPLVEGELEEWGLGPNHGRTTEQLLDAIDRGNYNGGKTGRECSFVFRPCILDVRPCPRPSLSPRLSCTLLHAYASCVSLSLRRRVCAGGW